MDRHETRNDRLEMVETVVFSLQVTISIQTSLQMLGDPWMRSACTPGEPCDAAAGSSVAWIGDLAFALALVTVLLQLLFATKCACHRPALPPPHPYHTAPHPSLLSVDAQVCARGSHAA